MAEDIAVEKSKEDEPKKVSDAEILAQIEAAEQERKLITHKELVSQYVGVVEEMSIGKSRVSFVTAEFMKADNQNMVFTGFLNAAAEYAAAVAINEVNTMIIHTSVSYYAPIRVGDEVIFTANVKHNDARKREVDVTGRINSIKVYHAKITIVITEYHPLKVELMDVATS